MGTYRQSRNFEASIIDYLTTELTAQWSSINVIKTFVKAYELSLPTVCIRVGTTVHDRAEIGADSTIRSPQVLIDIFASSDGQRLDIKDFIVEKVKSGMVYYEYEIANGAVSNKTANGRIRVLDISDTPINFDTEKSTLAQEDRYRHLITLTTSIGQIET